MSKPPDANVTQIVLPQNLPAVAKPKFQVPAHAAQQPYLFPGTKATLRSNGGWSVGTMVPYNLAGSNIKTDWSQDLQAGNYGFRFHYNPSTFSISSPAGFEYDPSTLSTALPLMAAPGTVSFQVLLNRSEDIIDGTVFGEVVLGCTSFAQLGTQYDIEWFYRVVNGVRTKAGQDALHDSADIGLLLPNPVLLTFSRGLQYAGYISNIQVDHLKFTPLMVPMVSLLNITVARFATATLPAAQAPQGTQ